MSAARVPDEFEPGSDQWWASKPRLLWVKDICQLFEVSAKTVDRWAHDDILCPKYTLGGQRRFPKEEVRRLWLEAHGSAE